MSIFLKKTPPSDRSIYMILQQCSPWAYMAPALMSGNGELFATTCDVKKRHGDWWQPHFSMRPAISCTLQGASKHLLICFLSRRTLCTLHQLKHDHVLSVKLISLCDQLFCWYSLYQLIKLILSVINCSYSLYRLISLCDQLLSWYWWSFDMFMW